MGTPYISEAYVERFTKLLDDIGSLNLYQQVATDQEKIFMEQFLRTGNATASVEAAFPNKYSEQTKKTLGVQLRRKFNLNKEDSIKFRKYVLGDKVVHRVRDALKAGGSLADAACPPLTPETEQKTANTSARMRMPIRERAQMRAMRKDDIVNFTKYQYELGNMSEEQLFNEMARLALHAYDDRVRIQATQLMREWLKEAKSSIEAQRLSELETVDLMIDALSSLPREKYIAVLRGVKPKRDDLIKRRNEKIDVDSIVRKERDRISQSYSIRKEEVYA
jgi:hypothetical protein